MGIVVLPKTLTAHTTAKAADVMADLNKLVEAVNGNIDRENLKDGEVITSKLANAAVTSPKLKPSMGIIRPAENFLVPVGGFVDVPKTEFNITPAVPSVLWVVGLFSWAPNILSEASAEGTIGVDGVDQAFTAPFDGSDTVWTNFFGTYSNVSHGERGTSLQIYEVPLTAAKHTIKMRGRSNLTATSLTKNSALFWMLVSQ